LRYASLAGSAAYMQASYRPACRWACSGRGRPSAWRLLVIISTRSAVVLDQKQVPANAVLAATYCATVYRTPSSEVWCESHLMVADMGSYHRAGRPVFICQRVGYWRIWTISRYSMGNLRLTLGLI
jgi:hypothetical protein